jgi:hypothetical protein
MQFYLDSTILIEFLHGLNYLIYNGFSREALRAIGLISQKADEELFCDVILMSNSIKNSIQLANNDLNRSKNTLVNNASPIVPQRYSAGTGSLYTCNDGTLVDDGGDSEEDLDSVNDISRQSKLLENSLTRCYIAPSPGERDAVRRASMKLRKAKQDIVLEAKKEINGFTRLDDIPIIDDSSGANDDDDDNNNDDEKKNKTRNGILY